MSHRSELISALLLGLRLRGEDFQIPRHLTAHVLSGTQRCRWRQICRRDITRRHQLHSDYTLTRQLHPAFTVQNHHCDLERYILLQPLSSGVIKVKEPELSALQASLEEKEGSSGGSAFF